MLSTMQDAPLTIGAMLRFGTRGFAESQAPPAGDDGGQRRRSFAEIGERAPRLANALRDLDLRERLRRAGR